MSEKYSGTEMHAEGGPAGENEARKSLAPVVSLGYNGSFLTYTRTHTLPSYLVLVCIRIGVLVVFYLIG